jgi:hypothetical protein
MLSELTTHQSYEAFAPRLNSGQIVLLDNADLQNQLLGLVWRGTKIDHSNNEHDDFAAVVARLASVLHGEVSLDEFVEMNSLAPQRSVHGDRDWFEQERSNDGLHPVDVLLDRRREDWSL